MTTIAKTKMNRLAAFVLAALVCLGLLAPRAKAALADPYVVVYTAVDAAGNELSVIRPGTTFTLAVVVAHPGAATAGGSMSNLKVRLNPGAFTMADLSAVECRDEGSGGDDLRYSAIFRNITYVGGQAQLSMNISYLDTAAVTPITPPVSEGSGGTTAPAPAGVPMSVLTVPVGQCIDDSTVPSVLMRSATFGGATVTAGNTFTLATSAYNGSTTLGLTDVRVSLSLPAALSMNGGAATVAVGSVAPGGTIAANFPLVASAGAENGVVNVTVTYNFYATVQGQTSAYTSTESVSIPVQQADRFTLGTCDVPPTIYMGEEGTVTLNYTNKGKGVLYNVNGEIKGTNLANPTSVYKGTLAAGAEGSVDFYILAEKAGPMSGTIILTYEDSTGAVHTHEKPFSITVEEMPKMPDVGPVAPVEPEKKGLSLPLLIGGVVVAGGMIGLIIWRKRKKAKAAAEEENEDF